MIHVPASFTQVHPGSVLPYMSPVLSAVSVLGSSIDALEQDAKKSRLAPVYVGPQSVGLFKPHRVSQGGWELMGRHFPFSPHSLPFLLHKQTQKKGFQSVPWDTVMSSS